PRRSSRLATAPGPRPRGGPRPEGPPVDPHLTGGGLAQAGHHVLQLQLAVSFDTSHPQDLTRPNLEAHVSKPEAPIPPRQAQAPGLQPNRPRPTLRPPHPEDHFPSHQSSGPAPRASSPP